MTKINHRVCINLGSGSHIIEEKGWLNIDNFYPAKESKYFLKGNALDLPLDKESVDYIICDQMLEHLNMYDVPHALYEMKRVLKKGGKAIIIVPDFEDAVRQWLAHCTTGAFEPLAYQYYSEPIYGNQMHEGEFHKAPMSPSYLHFVLNMVGLPNHEIEFWPADGKCPEFEGVRPSGENARLRNAQLVCKITK